MKLVVGLGNPGKAYEKTRHNVGFMAVDAWLRDLNETMTFSPRFKAFVSRVRIKDEVVVVLKPTTYMNLSGEAVKMAMDYHKIDIDDVLVVIDDVNLDPGRIRLRETGGHGGHNGLRNIIGILKTEDFKRVRIGVGLNTSMPLDKYVLSKIPKDEEPAILGAIDGAVDAIRRFALGQPFTDIMTSLNTRT
jgi:peptidyl-tRNA hydrolase, PTH1 family